MIKSILSKLIDAQRVRLFKLRHQIRLFRSPKIYISFGENCLTDNILERYGLKLFTSVFSHVRTNIEYILQIERDNYKDFLNIDYIKYEELDGKMFPRLKKYNHTRNHYSELHMKGIEFSHHDIIKYPSLRSKFDKRVRKLRSFIGQKKIVILYHHRANPLTDIGLLVHDLSELKELYSKGQKQAEVVCFTQQIITTSEQRSLHYEYREGIHLFTFHTLNLWEGDDQDIFWGRWDEDLIKQMIEKVKTL